MDYYLGNEALFTSPRSYQGLLEVSHFHLFAMGMLLLVLTHLRITSYNVCYTKLLRPRQQVEHAEADADQCKKRQVRDPTHLRITSYNVCYTKLLR